MGPQDFQRIVQLLTFDNEETFLQTALLSTSDLLLVTTTRQKITEYFPQNVMMMEESDEFKVYAVVILFNLHRFLQHRSLFNSLPTYQEIQKCYLELFEDWKKLFQDDYQTVEFIIEKIKFSVNSAPETSRVSFGENNVRFRHFQIGESVLDLQGCSDAGRGILASII